MNKYKFKLEKTLNNPHPLISQAIKKYNLFDIDRYGVKGISRVSVNIRVSPSSQNRAFRIMDSLFKCFEKNGYKIEKFSTYTRVIIGNEHISILLTEKTKLVAKTLREDRYSYETYDWLYEPTGILSLEINEYISENIKLKFADSKSIILEDQLIDFIDTVFKVAEIKKKDTEKREKENKEYEIKKKLMPIINYV